MKFLVIILMTVAVVAAFMYAVGLVFGKKTDKPTLTPLDDLEKKADAVARERDVVSDEADEAAKKAEKIKSKLKK